MPQRKVFSATSPSAFLRATVDIPSVPANSTLDVEINAPRRFRVGRPVLLEHASALNTGIQVSEPQVVVVSGVKKIRFRVQNNTAAAIDPAAQTFLFLQL